MPPQELQVVQCCSCGTFQVDIVKKVPKWKCKMCGEGQHLEKIYLKGSGQDCRVLVQQLNSQRNLTVSTNAESGSETSAVFKEYSQAKTNSKWNEFLPDSLENKASHEQGGKVNEIKTTMFEDTVDLDGILDL